MIVMTLYSQKIQSPNILNCLQVFKDGIQMLQNLQVLAKYIVFIIDNQITIIFYCKWIPS
jgi:hypothetical protein